MLTLLNDAANPAVFSFIEKKSEFIGAATHVDTQEEALAFVDSVRQSHPKARHVAFAAILSSQNNGISERMSDDGEPSGTAGKPILDALRKTDMANCVVTVTRYFGGVLLGSAGLIRAYSTAASGALKTARRARIVEHERVRVKVSYPQLGTLDHLLEELGGSVKGRVYTDTVESTILLTSESLEAFIYAVTESFQGGVAVEKLGKLPIAVALEKN